jgi:hypothetical protein
MFWAHRDQFEDPNLATVTITIWGCSGSISGITTPHLLSSPLHPTLSFTPQTNLPLRYSSKNLSFAGGCLLLRWVDSLNTCSQQTI